MSTVPVFVSFQNRTFFSQILPSLAVAIVALAPLQVARAIGPDNQTLNPTEDSVVRVLFNNPGNQDAGDGYMNGTGSIIGNHNIDGVGWLCVLTADHVISTNGKKSGGIVNAPGIAFGNAAKVSGNSPYFAGQVLGRFSTNGTSDIAVVGVPYGAYNPAYNNLVVNLVSASGFFYFTDIGYGNEGKLVTGGYQAQNKYGTERFLNDKIGTFEANYTRDGYTFEGAEWYVTDPTDPNHIPGSGTTFDADSGSPYFSSATNFDEGTGLSYTTDNQFAVHSGIRFAASTNNPAPTIAFGSTLIGDALTGNDIVWINNLCDAVPEPSAAVLTTVGVLVIFRWRRIRGRVS